MQGFHATVTALFRKKIRRTRRRFCRPPSAQPAAIFAGKVSFRPGERDKQGKATSCASASLAPCAQSSGDNRRVHSAREKEERPLSPAGSCLRYSCVSGSMAREEGLLACAGTINRRVTFRPADSPLTNCSGFFARPDYSFSVAADGPRRVLTDLSLRRGVHSSLRPAEQSNRFNIENRLFSSAFLGILFIWIDFL